MRNPVPATRDHAVFVLAAILALSHLLDELLNVGFPTAELYRLLVFVVVTALAVYAYPSLGRWRGPVAIVFGAGWTYGGLTSHAVDLVIRRFAAGELSGVLEILAGLLALSQGIVVTRDHWRRGELSPTR